MVAIPEDLKAKIARSKQALAEVRHGLEQLTTAPEHRMKEGWPAYRQAMAEFRAEMAEMAYFHRCQELSC